MAVCRVTLSALQFSQTIQNVLHFQKGDYVTSDLPVLLTNIRDHWLDVIRPLQDSTLTYYEIRGQILATGGDISILPVNLAGNGSSAANSPIQLALVMQFKTGISGRRNRGRYFVGGPNPNSINSGLFNSAHMTLATTQAATLTTRWCTALTYNWALVIHGGSGESEHTVAVTTIQPRAQIGTQRRRGIGIGM